MSAIFRNRFPANHWRASDYVSLSEPEKFFIDAEHGPDFAPSSYHIGSSFHEPAPVRVPVIDRPWVNAAFAVALGLAMACVLASGLGFL